MQSRIVQKDFNADEELRLYQHYLDSGISSLIGDILSNLENAVEISSEGQIQRPADPKSWIVKYLLKLENVAVRRRLPPKTQTASVYNADRTGD